MRWSGGVSPSTVNAPHRLSPPQPALSSSPPFGNAMAEVKGSAHAQPGKAVPPPPAPFGHGEDFWSYPLAEPCGAGLQTEVQPDAATGGHCIFVELFAGRGVLTKAVAKVMDTEPPRISAQVGSTFRTLSPLSLTCGHVGRHFATQVTPCSSTWLPRARPFHARGTGPGGLASDPRSSLRVSIPPMLALRKAMPLLVTRHCLFVIWCGSLGLRAHGSSLRAATCFPTLSRRGC